MSPVPGPDPIPPVPALDEWAWLEVDPDLLARVDHFVGQPAYPDRGAVLRHAARTYFKMPPSPPTKGPA